MCGTMGGILGTGGGIPVVSGLVGGTVGDYVKEYANGIIYLSDSLSGDVVFTLNVTKNEALKHPNWSMGRKISIGGSNLSVNNIMVGDCISLFVNSPVSTGIPGIINDCTKISVL